MRRVNSSSAAFGRLRIDSPGSTRNQMSVRRIQQLRLASERPGGVESGGFSPMIGAGYSTEQSPLLGAKHHQRPLHPIQSDLELEPSAAIPPLAVWIVPALCCALAYALYNIFIKKGSSHINPVLGGVILQLVAAALGCGLLLFLVVSPLMASCQRITSPRLLLLPVACRGHFVLPCGCFAFFFFNHSFYNNYY